MIDFSVEREFLVFPHCVLSNNSNVHHLIWGNVFSRFFRQITCSYALRGKEKFTAHSVEITDSQCGKVKNLLSPKKNFVKSAI